MQWEKRLDACKLQISFLYKGWNLVLNQCPCRLRGTDTGFVWKYKCFTFGGASVLHVHTVIFRYKNKV